MRIIRATGAVAAALRRYDPNIDVRYSWERRSWAIVFRPRRPDLIPPPVYGDGRLAEQSEAHISYRTKTQPVGYVKKLNWQAVERIIAADTTRAGPLSKQMASMQAQRDAGYGRQAKDRYKEARKYMNWHARTHPMAD